MADEGLSLDTKPEEIEYRDRLVVRFAGDSGDGMQLAGHRFTDASAIFGNDLATYPNFPAEIRAPQGTLAGVSSFQVHIADYDILTPGDAPDVLVAMNPAALKDNVDELVDGGVLILNSEAFNERNLQKAGYETNPLEDGTVEKYRTIEVPMEKLTKEAVEGTGLTGRGVLRSKNFLALGLLAWVLNRPTEPTISWIEKKFADSPEVRDANLAAFRAGYNYAITTEAFHHTVQVRPAELPSGTYTNVTGNAALAWGLVAAAQCAKLPLFYASYPITPASDLLEGLARFRNFGVRTFQAEDEIAAVGCALGAAFAGQLGVTGTSGPGLSLKGETISLASTMELPMLIIDVQRAGPSTGMPTKPEQSDLLFALHGRHGEGTIPIVAIASPADAFETTIEAARIAVKYMTPVILMSDAYIGTGSEPWRLPDLDDLPDISVPFAGKPNQDGTFMPYLRDPESLAREWAVPGTPGLEHRVGGLEKENITGDVSYDPENHQLMTDLRARKVAGIAADIPLLEVDADDGAQLLVLGWGGTYGSVQAAVRRVRDEGYPVAVAHLRYLNPFPRNLGEVVTSYEHVLVPEMNSGQLSKLLRAEYLVPAEGLNKVKGVPFYASEIEAKLLEILTT
ncbi:MAG: 2-oxoacid:acceptor oxidoreductase subunit alpha [Acidimicrobiia bacterium]